MGCLLNVDVHKANLHDTKTGFRTAMLAYIKYPTIKKFCGDKGYRGIFVHEVEEYLELGVDISEKIKSEEWQVIPKRWIVERTFGWLNNSRRISKDYEITCSSSETMIKISHIHTLLKRL